MIKIAENIKALRKSLGWTQIELAEKLNTSQKVITSYETGQKKPPINRLPDIAYIFGVTIEELIGSTKLNVKEQKKHLHKNSRTAQVQELFEKLPPAEQRAILKQIKALLG